jgi:2-polyprenyl-3-methyl-5-hydroxy-6-metoxy-1,4-benzoquinol methylase
VDEKYTIEKLKEKKVFQEQWYHSIELLPGVFTRGYDMTNISLTREILKGCEIKDVSCLDIGAMDCMITTLLKRRGAAKVVAYDRSLDSEERVALVKDVLQLDFEYIRGMKFFDLPMNLTQEVFDVVVFSGVLYHMFDPLAGLAIVRGLVRNGGLVVVETSAILNNVMAMYFNAGGRFYPKTNYWQICMSCSGQFSSICRR